MNRYNNKKRIMWIFLIFAAGLIFLSVTGFMNHPKFGRQPRGERLERIKASPNYRNGEFQNQSPTNQITSEKGRIRAMYDFLFEKRERNRPDGDIPVIKNDLKRLAADEELLVWFGHSSFFIQSGNKRILVDPVFVEASPVSFFNKPFGGTDIYKPEDMPDIDFLIITHDHWDHLDYRTVLKLNANKIICPLGVGEHFERWGFGKEKIIELDWHEQAALGNGFTVNCLPARHFSGRGFKRNQTLWASFLLETPVQKIYISGDGGYDKHFAEIGNRYRDIDVAILENGQYDKDWQFIHLLPEDLSNAIGDLKAKKIFTGHHSKYALARHPWDEPLKHAAAIGKADTVNIVMPTIGEVVSIKK